MIVPAALRRRFNNLEPELIALSREVQATVFRYCEQNGFAYIGRMKTLESLAEKIETGRFVGWAALDDLFGCAVIVPTLNLEGGVLEFLRGAFIETGLRQRGSTKKRPDVFRFEATRFIGKLRATKSSESSRPLFNTNFEVQIRSAFEHACVATTHALAYKSGKIDWKTQRMAAHLKAAVEQLDLLAAAFEPATEPIVEHEWPELSAMRLVADKFSSLVQAGSLPDVLAPKDWSRFAENLCQLIGSGNSQWRRDPIGVTGYVLGQLETEIASVGPTMIPMTLSLLQLAFGIMAKHDLLKAPLREYCPLITEELSRLQKVL